MFPAYRPHLALVAPALAAFGLLAAPPAVASASPAPAATTAPKPVAKPAAASSTSAAKADATRGAKTFADACAECHESADLKGAAGRDFAAKIPQVLAGKLKHRPKLRIGAAESADVAAYLATLK